MAEPRPPRSGESDPALEEALRDLGRELAFPATPDLASRMPALLEQQPPIPLPATQRRERRLLWLAAAVLALLLGTLALFPGVRTAIAERLGLSGLQIRWVEEMPTPAPVGTPLFLGRQVTLEEAQKAADFPVRLPTAEGFTTPNEIYLLGQGDDAMVSFVYAAREGLPESEVRGVGALLTQFRGEADRNLLEKGLRADDGELNTDLEAVTVAGARGFWISGAPHSVFLVCQENEECREERYRLAGNALLWEEDGVTFRLESALSREESLAVAASLQPAD